jgi:hypothetical protein
MHIDKIDKRLISTQQPIPLQNKKKLTAGASSDQGAEKIDSRRKTDKRTHSPWCIQSDP